MTSFKSRTGAVVPAVGDYLAVPTGGLTGATTTVRYVGGTASGHPTSGTFAVGDAVITQDGHIFICIGAGTPGTWVDAGSYGSGGGGVSSIADSGGGSLVFSASTGAVVANTGTLDVIATAEPPAASWSNNSHKITNLLNGSSAQDAAAFGQIPVPANGYGITGNTGLTPTPAVSLTFSGSSCGSGFALTASTATEILTSGSSGNPLLYIFSPGYWLIFGNVVLSGLSSPKDFDAWIGGAPKGGSPTTVSGSSPATIVTGVWNSGSSYNAGAASDWVTISVSALVTVSAIGYIGLWTYSTGTNTVESTTQANAIQNATGLFGVRFA